ncbi:MAG: acyl carrier protein [Pseudomonadota bacterium]
MSVGAQVIAILAQHAPDSAGEMTSAHSLADVGIDSVGLVQVLFEIEETFDVDVNFDPNTPPVDVADVIAAVDRAIAQNGQ